LNLIDITRIPVCWTTCDKSIHDRQPRMETMLDSIGIAAVKISGPITSPYTIGVAEGYMDALTRFNPPFLILEDDATLIGDINDIPEIELPKRCDAMYIGTSLFGRMGGKTLLNGIISGLYNEKTLRIFNMLGFHAIIYLTKSYVDLCVDLLEKFIEHPVGGCDDPVADNMYKSDVYCLKNPIFYQQDGRSDQATTLPVKPIW